MASSFIPGDKKDNISFQQICSHRAFCMLSCLTIGLYFGLRRNPRIKYHLKQFGGPPSYPVIGNLLSFIRPHHELIPLLDKWVEKYGRIFCLWIGNFRPYVILLEPDAIEVCQN